MREKVNQKVEDCSKILDFFERIAYLETKDVIDLDPVIFNPLTPHFINCI